MKLTSIILILFNFFSAIFAQELNMDNLSFDAKFPGGDLALKKFIKDNMIIPEACLNEGLTGVVYVRFTVDTIGNLGNIVVDSNDTKCKEYDLEARRIVQLMPQWIPGQVDGKVVKISYLLPIDFGFSDADVPDEEDIKFIQPNWAGIELGMTQLMNSSLKTNFDENKYWENLVVNSWVFNYNFLEYKIPIFEQYFGITTGMGYSWRGIGVSKNYQLFANSDTVYANSLTTELKTNKLSLHYLTIPLLLEFCTKKETAKNLYLSTGIVGTWRFYSYYLQKGRDDNGNKFTHYIYSRYNLNNLNLDFVLRLGYGYLGVFSSYQMNTLFKRNKTVPIYPLTIGLTINLNT
jgi:hypothetical protein